MARQTVANYLSERRSLHRREFDIISTGLAPHDPTAPGHIEVIVQFSTARGLLAPDALAAQMADDLGVDVVVHDEHLQTVRLRVTLREAKPTQLPSRVLIRREDLARLLRHLRPPSEVKEDTALILSAERADTLMFSAPQFLLTLKCQGTWSARVTVPLLSFRKLVRSLPFMDLIPFEAVGEDLSLGDCRTVFRL
jgi:hypothetical protein